MVRCSSPVLFEVLREQKNLPHDFAQLVPTPSSTSNTLPRYVEMCQNSNDSCRENNSFAKLSQHSARCLGRTAPRRHKFIENFARIFALVPSWGLEIFYGGAIFTVTLLLLTPCKEILTEIVPWRLVSCGSLTVTCHSQSYPGTLAAYSTGMS